METPNEKTSDFSLPPLPLNTSGAAYLQVGEWVRGGWKRDVEGAWREGGRREEERRRREEERGARKSREESGESADGWWSEQRAQHG